MRSVADQLAAVDEQHAEVEEGRRRVQQQMEELASNAEATIDELRARNSPLADTLAQLHEQKKVAAAAWQADLDTALQRSRDYRERVQQSIDVLAHSLSPELLKQMAKEKATKEASAALSQAASALDGSSRNFDTLLRPDEKP